MGQFFFLKNFLPHLCMLKMISASWGSFLGMYVGLPTDPPPPPPPRGPRRLAARPAYPLGLGQRRGGVPPLPPRRGPPPSATPEMVGHPSGSHPARQPPRAFTTSMGLQRSDVHLGMACNDQSCGPSAFKNPMLPSMSRMYPILRQRGVGREGTDCIRGWGPCLQRCGIVVCRSGSRTRSC